MIHLSPQVLELQLLKGLLTSFQPTNEQARKREVSLAGNNTMKEMKYLVEEIFRNYAGKKKVDASSQQLLEKCRYDSERWSKSLRPIDQFKSSLLPCSAQVIDN